jgi:hypothetical protein
MGLDNEVRLKPDTGYSSSTNYHDRRLQQLRCHHHYVPSETPWGTVTDNREKVTDSFGQRDVSSILKRAKPALPPEAGSVLETIKQYLRDSENKPSKDEYISAIKKALEILSPETLAEYKNYDIEFVLNDDVNYPTARKTEEGKWKLNLPTKYEYPIQGVLLRCFDEILKVEFAYAGDIVRSAGSHAKVAAGVFLTSRRAKMAARVFLANMMLGEKYGWDIKGYELAEKYHQDYYYGICKSFEEELINKNTSKDLLMRIGDKYASRKLLDSIMPTKDVPGIFPSMQPGAYFEEFNIKEREIKHKKPIVKFLVEEPIRFGSPKFDTLMEDINMRREKEEDSTLNVVIMSDKAILVLPSYFQGGQRSQHSIVAKGNPCVWAGEIKIKDNEVITIKDRSGHFKTFVCNDQKQKAIDDFALQAFSDQGYNVPPVIERTIKGHGLV